MNGKALTKGKEGKGRESSSKSRKVHAGGRTLGRPNAAPGYGCGRVGPSRGTATSRARPGKSGCPLGLAPGGEPQCSRNALAKPAVEPGSQTTHPPPTGPTGAGAGADADADSGSADAPGGTATAALEGARRAHPR